MYVCIAIAFKLSRASGMIKKKKIPNFGTIRFGNKFIVSMKA